jgi:hypothetical protein
MAISLFNTLEEFLKERFRELMEELPRSPIGYGNFPEELNLVLTVRALSGLSSYLSRLEKAKRLASFETHVGSLLISHGYT